MNYQALRNEIINDPISLGYAGKTDSEIASLLNTVPGSPIAGRQIDREIIDTWEILEATVQAEWGALSAAEKQRYQTIVGAGTVSVKGTNVRNAFLQMFAAGTQTRTNLAALQTRAASRAEVLGFRPVSVGDVNLARTKDGGW